jgi:hypothetical protein
MDTFQDTQRWFDRAGASILQFSPQILGKGLDGWFVFRQRELGAEIPVEVRVRYVVNHLADGPTAGAIWSIELAV